MAYYFKIEQAFQISTTKKVCHPTIKTENKKVKRISWTIVAALVASLFLPVNAAQADGTIWINPSTSLTTTFHEAGSWGAGSLKSNSDGTRLVSRTTQGQIVTSSDSGFNWRATGQFSSDYGMCLSRDGSTIILNDNESAGGPKLHKSVNFGLTWTSTPMVRAAYRMSCSGDAQKIVLYIGNYRDYEVSTDSGSTWTYYRDESRTNTIFQQQDAYMETFEYSPDGNLLLASGDARVNGRKLALFVSEDNGQTWRNTNLPDVFIFWDGLQAVAAANGKIIVTGQDKDGRYELPQKTLSSTDKGQTWQTVTSPPGSFVFILSSDDGATLYAIANGHYQGSTGTFKSTNFGATWSSLPAGSIEPLYMVQKPTMNLSGDGKALSVITSSKKFYTYNTNLAFSVSSDASFTFQVNGQNVVDGGTVNLPANTSNIEVTTITSQTTSTVTNFLYVEEYDYFENQGSGDCPTAGTCTQTMETRNYRVNRSGVDTYKIEVIAPDQVTKLTKTFTTNQPFTKKITLEYDEEWGFGWVTNKRQQALPGSGSGLSARFDDNKDWGPYRTHFVAWSDGSTQNPRTDTFTTDVIVRGLWGLNAGPGKLYIDYLAQKWGNVTLVNSAGVDTFDNTCERSQGVCQQILPGASGSSVTAVPNEGSRFIRWSDGSTANPRRDLNVAASFSVTAEFSSPAAVVTAGIVANSQVATFVANVKTAEIPATEVLPAITLSFGGTTPTAVTVAPVASNPAVPASTPFKISGSTKIVDITPTGTFTGSATVCLDGASTDSIFHFTGGAWVELPGRSYANGQICGVTTSFSPFAAALAMSPAEVAAAAAAEAAALRNAEIQRTRTEMVTSLKNSQTLTVAQFAKAGMAGITTGNIAAVLEEINALPSASRTDINQVIKIAHKYEVVGNIGSNRVNGVASYTYIEVGLIPAKSKNKMALVSVIRKLPVESRDSYAEIKAAIDAEIAKIAARINRKVKQ
jgi:hypothetical protein